MSFTHMCCLNYYYFMKHYLVKHKLGMNIHLTLIWPCTIQLNVQERLNKKIKKAYHDLGIRIRSQFSAYKFNILLWKK